MRATGVRFPDVTEHTWDRVRVLLDEVTHLHAARGRDLFAAPATRASEAPEPATSALPRSLPYITY